MIATTTALAIAAGTTAVVGAAGIVMQGQAASKMKRYNAELADKNAAAQRNNSISARQEAANRAKKIRRLASRVRGSQIVSTLKSGSTTGGSAADLMYDSALEAEEDALSEIYKGQRSSINYITAAQESVAEAGLNRAEARAIRTSSTIQAAGVLTSGAGQAYGLYKNPTLN